MKKTRRTGHPQHAPTGNLVWTWVGPLPHHATSPSTPWISLDIRLFAFPALCDAYATYATFALSRAYATSAHLRRLKRECSRASCTTVTPYSHHQPSIAMSSSRPYILLMLHHRLNTAFAHFRFISANVPALRAPIAPYSRA
ncbi:hypothetical protein P692DRAFT_20884007 [Suillus brevipes Sb2]|nr:hypothetical protein P692DRAFT_20884007 [Suillus brevipes Sb2]